MDRRWPRWPRGSFYVLCAPRPPTRRSCVRTSLFGHGRQAVGQAVSSSINTPRHTTPYTRIAAGRIEAAFRALLQTRPLGRSTRAITFLYFPKQQQQQHRPPSPGKPVNSHGKLSQKTITAMAGAASSTPRISITGMGRKGPLSSINHDAGFNNVSDSLHQCRKVVRKVRESGDGDSSRKSVFN